MAQNNISLSTTVPAPTGGLNAFNPISNMPEQDAIIMRNFFPEPFGCRVRKGYKEHATGLDGEVNSFMTFVSSDGTSKLFAVDQSQVMDITAPGDYSAGTPECASTNSYWQHTNFANVAGTHMIAFNGVDDGILYSDDGLHRLVAGDGTTPYTWAGVDPADLVVPCIHQHRVWAVEKNSTKGWYLPPEQVWGVATYFDFGGNFARGGYLQTLVVYTQDSGYGPDDYLVAISSAGDMCIYKGIDPSALETWSLVGTFYTGATFTRRCTARFGGDIAILTRYGMITVGSLAKPDNISVLDNALSQRIQNLISEVIGEGSYRYGWAILLYPAANMMIINVPGVVPEQTFQLVYNTITKAWSMFTGMHANCWWPIFDSIVYGENGVVYRAWEGYLDGVKLDGTGGEMITAECQQAFSYFKLPGQNKHFKMFRPTFLFAGEFKYRAGANMDFDFATQPPPAAFNSASYGVWNQSLWSTNDVWAGGSQSSKYWASIVGIGYAAAIRLSVTTPAEVVWVSTDWLYERGGVI